MPRPDADNRRVTYLTPGRAARPVRHSHAWTSGSRRTAASSGPKRTRQYSGDSSTPFLLHLYRSGARVVHLHPATSLVASVGVLGVAPFGRSDAVNVGIAVAAASTPWRDDAPTNGRGIEALLYGGNQSEQGDRPSVIQSLLSSSSNRVASGTPSAISDAMRVSMAGRSGALLLKLVGLRARMASINKHQRRPTPWSIHSCRKSG